MAHERLDQPGRWKKPRMIFVNSMSDLFHKKVPKEFIDDVFDRMEDASHHTYQVLTKRSSLMRNYLKRRYPGGEAPEHIWCGVSVEDSAAASRIRHLQAAPAAVRFLSIEPLIGPVGEIDLTGISWVIVGGESGPNALRSAPCNWNGFVTSATAVPTPRYRSSSKPCQAWGGKTPKAGGRLLDDKEWNELPRTVAPESAVDTIQKAAA